MNIEDMPRNLQFVFISLLRSAIIIKEEGKDKKFFINFASEIWEKMNLNDIEDLKNILSEYLKADIEKMMKEMNKK
jgi:hypothetical protein